jgi:hypothetical protein
MKKILELVHEWKNTICVTSKHKEDLVHIRDMHRLLSYKGAWAEPASPVVCISGDTDVDPNCRWHRLSLSSV